MHEMSLAENVLQVIEATALRENAQKVGLVVLEIGRLAAVENEALAFCFEAVCKGSVAEGAELEIVEVPGVGWCVTCAQSIPMEQLYGDCPLCGGFQTHVTGGTGMRVLEIGIE